MKNIFVALALFFALGASAQVKKAAVKETPVKVLTADEAAQKDLDALNAFLPLSENVKPNVLKLLVTKHRTLKSDPTLSEGRKSYLAEYNASRLELLLGAEDYAKVKGNATLFSKLTK